MFSLNERDNSRMAELGRHGLHHPASGWACLARPGHRDGSQQLELLWGEPSRRCLILTCHSLGGTKLSPAPAPNGSSAGLIYLLTTHPAVFKYAHPLRSSQQAVINPARQVLWQFC